MTTPAPCSRAGRHDPRCEGAAIEHRPFVHTPTERLCAYHHARVVDALEADGMERVKAERERRDHRRMWRVRR